MIARFLSNPHTSSQMYILSKEAIPMDIEFMLEDSFEFRSNP